MEGLTRLVSESLARHGFDRPLDYRRLHWSRWFRCESHHSLLFVPSKPGVFAVAEEIMDLARPAAGRSESEHQKPESEPRRMLAVTKFFESDDMAFMLDRMLSHQNPMRTRLESGRYFVRFVVIEDHSQRLSIVGALNQWISSSAEKATGIGGHFASSLELTPATEYVPQPDDAQASLFGNAGLETTLVDRALQPATADTATQAIQSAVRPAPRAVAPHVNPGSATNIHSPSQFPSGF